MVKEMYMRNRSSMHSDIVRRAKELIPGGTTNSIVPPEGLEFISERGEGPYIYDIDGRRFLDFLMGGGPLILGHAHPRIIKAIRSVLEKGTHHFALHRRTVELAERLVRYIPSAEMVRFTSSGSEATFHALRLARAVTRRAGIIKFDGAYHGHHDLATWSFEHTPSNPPIPAPESAGIQQGVSEDIVVLPFNDPNAVREMLKAYPKRFAAVICEPLQRALPPKPGFLQTLREECDRTGTVLIFDEVVTGFRLARGCGQEKYGVTPDLTTLGKALTGGLPMSALVGKRWLMEHLDPKSPAESFSFHCGTYNGYLWGVECAHVSLDILVEEGGVDRLQELGEMTRAMLKKVFSEANFPVFVAGDGPIFHPYFTDRVVESASDVRACNWNLSNRFHLKLLEAGIYKSFVKGYLSLAHQEEHIEEFAEAARWALKHLDESTRSWS
jgi:glutamate-1-semialdehyde 2,1-aminomutase